MRTHRSRGFHTTLVGLTLALLAAGVAGAAYNRVQIPIRWCVVSGSPAALNAACACAPSTPWVTLYRNARASVQYANCNIVFRGAGGFNANTFFPSTRVIADPCDPAINPACPGTTGDIFVDLGTVNINEYNQVINACRQAWNGAGIGAAGIIGVNVDRFVDAAGNQANVWGLGGVPVFNNAASQAAWGEFAVMDDDYFLDYTNFPGWGNLTQNTDTQTCFSSPNHPATPPCQPQLANDGLDLLTSHEIGHALSLNHTNNTLMTAAGLQAALATPWLSQGGLGQTELMCPAQPLGTVTSQCGQVRLQSMCHQNGTLVDPPPVVDELPLAIGDASPGWIDLDLVGLIDDSNTTTAGFFWRSIDPFPTDALGLTYEFALDLDQDPFTGGDPSTVGIGVPQTGVELAGSVVVDVVSGSITTLETLWRWEPGAFAFVPEPTLGSDAASGDVWVDDLVDGSASPVPGHSIVSMRFDALLIAGGPTHHTFRARAVDPALAGEDLGPTAELYMNEPGLSICTLDVPAAVPGATVQVDGANLPPNAAFEIHFDERGAVFPVGSGVVGPGGVASGSFLVPTQALAGPRTVRLFVTDPGLDMSSVCTLEVLSADGPPGESSIGASPLIVTGHDPIAGSVDLDFGLACGATGHTVYGTPLPMSAGWSWESIDCGHCLTGSTTFTPPPGSHAFVIVGHNDAVEGSYGTDHQSNERPPADESLVGTCKLPQDLSAFCLP